MPRRNSLFPLFSNLLLIGLLFFAGCQKSPAATPVENNGEPPTEESGAVSTEPPTATDVPAATPAPLPELTFAVQTTTAVPANGEAMTTENGAAVQIAPDALGEGVTAAVSEWAIDPSWQRALEQVYTIEVPFVSLAVSGANDSQGRAVLRLPAPSPESRLVAFIDNTYLAILDTQPQDGFLETAVRLGPADVGSVEQIGSLTPGGSLQYTVLTPLMTASIKKLFDK